MASFSPIRPGRKTYASATAPWKYKEQAPWTPKEQWPSKAKMARPWSICSVACGMWAYDDRKQTFCHGCGCNWGGGPSQPNSQHTTATTKEDPEAELHREQLREQVRKLLGTQEGPLKQLLEAVLAPTLGAQQAKPTAAAATTSLDQARAKNDRAAKVLSKAVEEEEWAAQKLEECRGRTQQAKSHLKLTEKELQEALATAAEACTKKEEDDEAEEERPPPGASGGNTGPTHTNQQNMEVDPEDQAEWDRLQAQLALTQKNLRDIQTRAKRRRAGTDDEEDMLSEATHEGTEDEHRIRATERLKVRADRAKHKAAAAAAAAAALQGL